MTYPGGKGGAGVAQIIINQQPPHDTYIEAFLGSGAIMRAKRQASTNIGIDVEPLVTECFHMENVTVLNCNAIDYIARRREWTGRELVYCDPPYLKETRRSRKGIYRHEMSDLAHSRLLGAIVNLPCMVQISGYDSLMYRTWLKGWRLVQFQAMTRRGLATECLWMNYPEPTSLHDYRYLGKDFRERERIRRKTERWTLRLESLPTLEKLAIYSEMASRIAKSGDGRGRLAGDLPGSGLADGSDARDSGNIAEIVDRIRPEPAEMVVLQ